jgi:hypothetical protein
MACSEETMKLVRTTGGLTPADPWTALSILGFDVSSKSGPSPSEYEQWRELTKRLTSVTYEHLYILGKCEEQRGQGFPAWNEHVEQVKALWEEGQSIENVLGTIFSFEDFSTLTTMTKNVSRMIEICIDAVCEMEAIDGAIMTYGCLAPKEIVTGFDTPGGKKGGMGVLGTIAVVGVTGALIYGVVVLAKRSGSSESGEAAA